jgi:hypothetical protein
VNYRSGLRVERADCDEVVGTPTFGEWYYEAVRADAVSRFKGGDDVPPHEWHWPGFEALDPVADATADQERLANGTLTWREFWGQRGYDWRDVMRQQAAERKEIERLKLHFGEPATTTVSEQEAGDDAAADAPAKPAAEPARKDDKAPAARPAEKVVKKALAAADVQNTALNGAQVASMIAVCDKLVAGEYTGEATKAILRGSFPGLADELIDTIVTELEGHTPPEWPEPAKESAHAS